MKTSPRKGKWPEAAGEGESGALQLAVVNRAGAVGQPGSRALVNQTCLAGAERTTVGPSRKEGCVDVEMEGVQAAEGTVHSRWPGRGTGGSLV